MRIEFSGAAGTVTGSSHLLRVKDKRILLDCGLYQGKDEKDRGNDVFAFIPSTIDYLILSHAHIDHSGRIPLLYKRGFRGKVFATPPAKALSEILLMDSAFIHEQDAEWENKKRQRKGLDPVEPLYTVKDAEGALTLFEAIDFNQRTVLFPGFEMQFLEAGHMLGAAITELFIQEEERKVKLVYTGDLGNQGIPLMKEPVEVEEADFLIMESTYGNRLHPDNKTEHEELIKIINETYRKGGNVIIPSFAVGRTQELLYILNEFQEAGRLERGVKVYVDSPLASKSTQIFKEYSRYFDEESQERMRRGDHVLEFRNLFFTESVEDSMELNRTKKGCVIISASGMATAGRIRHHLKHNLWRAECSVIFVGYQAEGSLGRIIQDGAKTVNLFGEDIAVHAKIYSFSGLSGHADRRGLYNWVKSIRKGPKEIFLTHGDLSAATALKELLSGDGYNVRIAKDGDIVPIRDYVKLVPKIEETDLEKTAVATALSRLRKKEELIKYIETVDFTKVDTDEILKDISDVLKKQ
ncbi:MBL fold metallo-hydrolase RNA specificity domain-containing protein [Proteiniclasticum ruminis]|uniref:Metallo-beta-lactamase family protein n=1 Tax=Proteiniclasticum ruminis TaxID=398199 RepID=A0A1G8NR86_9CLOT|nr:MBL fold metallo-hydrolase [Proteiniclasticum ruminis]SDI82000.1 metallo-beta-lactamase family protein [Proteiniclasticum ruminis]